MSAPGGPVEGREAGGGAVRGAEPGQPARNSSTGLAPLTCTSLTTHNTTPPLGKPGEHLATTPSLPPPNLRSKVQTLLTVSPGCRERAQSRGGQREGTPTQGLLQTLCLPPADCGFPPCGSPHRSDLTPSTLGERVLPCPVVPAWLQPGEDG